MYDKINPKKSVLTSPRVEFLGYTLDFSGHPSRRGRPSATNWLVGAGRKPYGRNTLAEITPTLLIQS